jgi:hypothetical protein
MWSSSNDKESLSMSVWQLRTLPISILHHGKLLCDVLATTSQLILPMTKSQEGQVHPWKSSAESALG